MSTLIAAVTYDRLIEAHPEEEAVAPAACCVLAGFTSLSPRFLTESGLFLDDLSPVRPAKSALLSAISFRSLRLPASVLLMFSSAQ